MTTLIRRLARQRHSEAGFSLPELIVAIGLVVVIVAIATTTQILGMHTTEATIQRNDNTNASANAFMNVRRDLMAAQHFSIAPDGAIIDIQHHNDQWVRYEFLNNPDDSMGNVLVRRTADGAPYLGAEWSAPRVIAFDFSSGSFEQHDREASVNIGDDKISVVPSSNYVLPPNAPSKSDGHVNAEHLLRQDIEQAVSKDGSTSEVLYLRMLDDSYVRWTIDGSRLVRSTAVDAGSPFTDERVIANDAHGAHFSYDHYATRDITLTVDEVSTHFTIPLRAPM